MELVQNKHVQAISSILKTIGERVEGNLICDINPDNYQIHRNLNKIKNLQYLCKDKRKIIEIGINACHSLLLMILVNPTAEYLLFDLNNHTYTVPTLDYIRANFPDTKINAVFGDSCKTIHAFISMNPEQLNTYDLIHLDGGHTEDVFSQDYANSKKLATDSGIIIFDDYDLPNINKFINEKLRTKEIVEVDDKNIIKNDLHFIYSYANTPSA